MSAAKEAVQAGTDWLDANWDGYRPWQELIDVDRLDIRYEDRCILGQLYPGEESFLDKLIRLDIGTDDVFSLGFDYMSWDDAHELTAEWKRRLTEDYTKLHIVFVSTTLDVNGNPRNGWLINDGESVTFVKRCYEGNEPLYAHLNVRDRDKFWDQVKMIRLETTVKQYNQLIKGESK